MNNSIIIEVLHVENCPHLPKTLENLQQVILELNIKPKIINKIIRNQEEANFNKFLGSTSIRINGEDIYPINSNQYSLN